MKSTPQVIRAQEAQCPELIESFVPLWNIGIGKDFSAVRVTTSFQPCPWLRDGML
jgi:hypothetical protein